MALENIQLAEQMTEGIEPERAAPREMVIGKQVQAKLFLQRIPPLETLEYLGARVQARTVGGDYYDSLDLSLGRLTSLLADVAGKGVSAAPKTEPESSRSNGTRRV